MFRRPVLMVVLATGLATGGFWAASVLQSQTPPPSPTLRTDPVSFRDVVKTVLPAVVSVDSRAVVSGNRNRQPNRRGADDGDPGSFQRFFEELERKQQPDGPSSERRIGFGSGFILDPKGIVITNFHVVQGAERVEITLQDGRKFESKDIKGDQRTDIAIVRFDPKGTALPWLEFGDSDQMEIGDRVLAIGAPFGLSGTVTHGIISAKARDLNLNRYDDFIQTDAAINPGNSGGPLVNLESKVIGINSAIKTGTGGFQGVSMAISSNMAKNVVRGLIREGIVKRPYIGIEAAVNANEDANVHRAYGLNNGGVIVGRVRDNTPAAKAGLKADDAIIRINGRPIRDIRELQRTIAGQVVGATIEVELIREGKPLTVKIKLEEEPENYGTIQNPNRNRITYDSDSAVTVEYTGMQLASVTAAQANQRGMGQKGAAIITAVEPGSIAHTAGLGPGVVILRVNRKPVLSAEEAKAAIEDSVNGDGTLLHVSVRDAVALIWLKSK